VSVVVVGLGEVGKPLLELVRRAGHDAVGIDLEGLTGNARESIDVMHICFPFEGEEFVAETVRYIEALDPKLTVINSTVAVGTTRAVAEKANRVSLVHSPVRGKHTRMLEELTHYTKFVGGMDHDATEAAAEHFRSLGMTTVLVSSPEVTELAKLTETTYFGLLIAWAQQIERYCDAVGLEYDEIVSFYDEIDFFPKMTYFPGVIGGHCVLPNVDILNIVDDSELLSGILWSNKRKVEREARRSHEATGVRSEPEAS
jgi:UDP-N-acetyl-D-mannosaminuronate dehydrogenase